jgi:hypothetical protein
MPLVRITACLTIDEKDTTEIMECILNLIDSFVVKRLPIFDSDIISEQVPEVDNVEELRQELQCTSR